MARPPTRPPELDDQLCFALYRASRAIVGRYREGLAAIGLTYSQYLVMLVLWEEGTVTMGELCARLHLDSGTLSPLVKRLEAAGLVRRTRSAVDERVLEVGPTPRGRALAARAARVQASVEQATGLSQPDLARLRRKLHGLAAGLDAGGGTSRAG